MVAPNPPNFDECAQKFRCLGGVNDGQPYSPSDPCPPGYEFDELGCDCVPVTP